MLNLSLGRGITRNRQRPSPDALLAASSVIVSPTKGHHDDSPLSSRSSNTPKAHKNRRGLSCLDEKWCSSPAAISTTGDVSESGQSSDSLSPKLRKEKVSTDTNLPLQLPRRPTRLASPSGSSSTMRQFLDATQSAPVHRPASQSSPVSQSATVSQSAPVSQVRPSQPSTQVGLPHVAGQSSESGSLARSTRVCSNAQSPSGASSRPVSRTRQQADVPSGSRPATASNPSPRQQEAAEPPRPPPLGLSQILAKELSARMDAGMPVRRPASGAAGRGSLLLARRSKYAESDAQAELTVSVTPSSSICGPPRRQIRPLPPNKKIYDLYYWEEALQETGDGGKVVVCRQKDSTSERFDYVMKIRSKVSMMEEENLEQFRKSQEKMLNIAPHAGVTPLHEVLEDENFFYVVMPKATGGNFLCYLATQFQDGVMPMSSIKKLMREILEAVSHMHKQGILHRDIKPDNMVMESYDDPESPTGKSSKVMLIDFDHADPDFSPAIPKTNNRHAVYGTLRFNAPETYFNIFSQESDLYSVGTTLYLLMTGKLPYDDDIFNKDLPGMDENWKETIFRRMREADVDWQCDPWPKQRACKEFCQSLLAFDARHRFKSADVAMAHPWFSEDDEVC